MQRSSFHTIRGRGMQPDSSRRLAIRIKNTLLILLVVSLAVSLIIGIPSIRYRSGAKEYMVNRMEVECGDARYYLTKLSNTGGSSTYAQLAKIRSEIYAMQILSQTYAGMDTSSGNLLVDDSVFSNLFTLIDNYYSSLLTSATNTSSLLADLDASLSGLQDLLATLH